ncbi:protein Iojap-related, mitochondrial-like [Setaria viridis]|uniref:protein Iojap-related, mitochondrial-like n=1 Tax=Setaria viridis TaxID=4556 RepID=UPI003B3B206A
MARFKRAQHRGFQEEGDGSQGRPETGTATAFSAAALLELPEVEKVLRDVRAGDVRIFPVGVGGVHGGACADYMVVATGRSDWHVCNIAQALLYKPLVISGSIIIHALEERAREDYDLESIWSKEVYHNTSVQVSTLIIVFYCCFRR